MAISVLRRLGVPTTLDQSRVIGAETIIFRVPARLVAARTDQSGTVQVVVADPVTADTMIVKLPSSHCTTGASAAARSQMAQARATFLSLCGQPEQAFVQLRGRAIITGVGFFEPSERPSEQPPLLARFELAPVTALSSMSCRSGPATGVYGVVVGPARPVCKLGTPCWTLLPDVGLVFSVSGHDIARTRSASDGTYRIDLAPGIYSVRVEPPRRSPGGGLHPSTIRVTDDPAARADLRIDTGIRGAGRAFARGAYPDHKERAHLRHFVPRFD
jgi:hypothetical protein